MIITLINGSPKPGRGASAALLQALSVRLPGAQLRTHRAAMPGEGIWADVRHSDAVVFAFPLYVDGLPAHFVRFLEGARGAWGSDPPGTRVYAIANNGFFEGRQNAVALAMMRNFCIAAGLPWMGGIGVGGGGMIASPESVGRGPLRSLEGPLNGLAEAVIHGELYPERAVNPAFPRFLYMLAGNMSWKRAARRNGLKGADLYRKAAQ